MKQFARIIEIVVMITTIGLTFASCESEEEKAAKAAAEATASLITTLGGTDAAAIQEVLKTAGSAAFTALTASSASPGGDFSYDLNETGDGIIIEKYSGNGGLVIVPAEIEGYPVVEVHGFFGGHENVIGDWTDSNNGEAITAIVLPDSVVKIGSSAFESCMNLHTINIPAGIKEINYRAFTDCENLYNLTIPDTITAIDFSFTGYKSFAQFSGCGKLPLAIRKRLQDLGYTGDRARF